jgi:hypothetical protein
MTNDAIVGLLGFSKSELKGKNVKIIMPPTMAEVHTKLVRNFVQTGACVRRMNLAVTLRPHAYVRVLGAIVKGMGLAYARRAAHQVRPESSSPNHTYWAAP